MGFEATMTASPSKIIADLIMGVGASPAPPPDSAAPHHPRGDAGFDDLDPDEPPPADLDWELLRRCATEPQNDIGNSRRLRARKGEALIHVQNIGWHAYDGRRWKEDADGAATRPVCHEVVEAIALERFVLEPSEREKADIEAAETAADTAKAHRQELRRLSKRDAGEGAAARKTELTEELRELERAIERGGAAVKALAGRKAQRSRFANASGNKGKLDAMLAEALPYRSRAVGDLDADPLALNVGNGTLRLVQREVDDLECPDPDVARTKLAWVAELTPHDRADMISKLADVDFDPSATAPIFERFLERILPVEPVRDYVQRYLGYSITGLTREQCFCVFHGEGRNGKSTLVDIVARILAEYSTSLPIDSLLNTGGNKKGSEATPDLARLPGARFVRTAEPKEGAAFDESLIKGLTSSEPIPVRRLNQEFNDIYPTFKLAVSVNRKPPVKGNDDGIWRRINLVPFEVQIPPVEVDRQLGDKLWTERAGILNWLVAGCVDYLTRGRLDPPPEVSAATQEYRDDSDVMATFARGALDITRQPTDTVEVGRLYQAFELFCRRSAVTPFAKATFTRRLPATAKQLGFEKGKASVSIYVGIRIRPEFEPRIGAPGLPDGDD